MITVTKAASEELLQVSRSVTVKELELVPRMVPGPQDSVGFMLDTEREGDQVVQYEGTKILLMDMTASGILEGWMLDCKYCTDGRRFVVVRQ